MSTGSEVTCEQVVFTSVRTPTGEGYRIIAASPGARADEKIEITTHSPSHGSLVESTPEPVGLLSYRLGSGRHCVGYVCHAGVEHTGRGGQRVYTHMCLLDDAAYRSFGSNPVAVHSVIGKLVRELGPMLKPPARVEPLTLRAGTPAAPTLPDALDWIGPAGAECLTGRRLLLTGEKDPLALLNWILLSLPRNLRERFSTSVDVRYAPVRGMHLVLLQSADPQLPRQVAGQDIRVCAVGRPPPAIQPVVEPWFGLLRRWRNEGRIEDIVTLTSQTCAETAVSDLARVAAICEDSDQLEKDDEAGIERVTQRYPPGGGRTPAEQALIRQLHSRAEELRSSMTQPAVGS